MFIDDSTGTLSASAKDGIQSVAGNIDVKIIVASTGSRAELDAQVGRLVNSGNTLAIGIDPIHRYTFTHFGSNLGISPSDFQSIARSGNFDFKTGDWAGGLRAIVSAARAEQHHTEAQSTRVIVQQQPATVIEHTVSPWPFVIGGLVFVILMVAFWRWARRKQEAADEVLNDFRDEAGKMRSRNIEEQAWHDRMAAKQPTPEPLAVQASPETRQAVAGMTPKWPAIDVPRRTVVRERVIERAAPAPVIIQQQGGGNDMLTGMLIGQAISQPRVVEVEHHRHRTPTPEPSSSSNSSSWDSGSSGSSWDSGSGGGGFDSGGGGSDSGSGGGDF